MNPYVFFDYGGTIEQTTGFLQTDAEFCAAARGQLDGVLTPEGLEKASAFLADDGALAAAIRSWMESDITRKHYAETEPDSSRMWCDILGIDSAEVCGSFPSVAEELSCALETRGFHRVLRPNLRAAVEELRDSGWRVGIISNMITRRRMPRELEAHLLTDLFSPVVQSSEYGFRKPDPSIFHHAARLAGVPTGMCWYVGDTYSRDVLGARRAGYAGVIHVTGSDDLVTDELRQKFPEGHFRPDESIDDLADLPSLLNGTLNARRAKLAAHRNGSQKPWVKALIFDASDVLYYRPARGEGFAAFLARIGVPDARAENGPASGQAKELEERAFTGEIDREQHYSELLRLHNVTDAGLIDEGMATLAADSDRVDFFPGIPATLRALSEDGIQLGVVSNTVLPLHDKLKFFEQGGFGDVWDSIILSVDVGACKPDPAIYLRASEQLGLDPGECAFVGHEAYEISGARAAGMRTISFNCDAPIGAERHVQCFSDLLTAILAVSGEN